MLRRLHGNSTGIHSKHCNVTASLVRPDTPMTGRVFLPASVHVICILICSRGPDILHSRHLSPYILMRVWHGLHMSMWSAHNEYCDRLYLVPDTHHPQCRLNASELVAWPNVAEQRSALPVSIWDDPGSNVGPENDDPDRAFSSFSSVPPSKMPWNKAGHYRFLTYSSQFVTQ